jgi:hypothetical protein
VKVILLCGGDRRHRTHDRFSGNAFTRQPHALDAAEISGIWELFEKENAGKYHRFGGLAFAASQRAPKKAPHLTVAALERHWMSVEYLDAIFWPDFSAFPAISLMQWTFLDVLERYWMVGRGRFRLSLRSQSG